MFGSRLRLGPEPLGQTGSGPAPGRHSTSRPSSKCPEQGRAPVASCVSRRERSRRDAPRRVARHNGRGGDADAECSRTFANIPPRRLFKPARSAGRSAIDRLRFARMSLWVRPATILPRFVEEAMRDFRHMERMMFTPLFRSIPFETSAEGPAVETVNNESKFAVTIDVSKFKPENLKVNIDGRQLTVEGKEERKDDNGYSMSSFVRQWVLPENVNLEAIRSSLSENGRLSVEAPKVTNTVESGRSIPIERVSEKE